MLKHISPLLSPELLKILCEMGHGDELVLADANFPAAALAKRLVRADGVSAEELLDAVLQLFPLDQYDAQNFLLMEKALGDDADVSVWERYRAVAARYEPQAHVTFLERFAFYERARNAYAVVATGERAQYANILLKKGCVISGR